MIVLNRFEDELAELVLPEDTLVVPLHQSADYFQGLNAVIEDAFRGILVFILANHLPEIICFLVDVVTEGGLKTLFAPRGGIDSCDKMDGVLNSVGEGTATLLDKFEHHGGDSDLLRELGLGQSGDPPRVMQRMDFLGDTSWTRFHLTKVTGNHYPSSSNMITLSENHSSQEKPSWEHAYLTREQVAEYLQISERKVSDMTTKGELPAVKLGIGRNASIRYRRSAVDEALLKMRIN